MFGIFSTPVKDRAASVDGPVQDAPVVQPAAELDTTLVDLVPVPVVAIGRDFAITYVNDAAAQVAGRTREACVGALCYEVFKADHCRTAECRCAQAMETGRTVTGETIASPAGTPVPIRYTGAPLRDASGAIAGAVEFILDISQEAQIAESVTDIASRALEGFLDRRADAELFEGNNRTVVEGINSVLDALVGHMDAMPTPAVIVDRDFTVRYLNEAAAGVVGLPAERARGQKCYELFKAGDCRSANCALGRCMSSGQTETSETDAHPQGLDLFISYSGVPIRDARGEIIGAMEIVTDQTSLTKAMRDSAEKVEYLNSIPTPVVVMDKDYTVRFINPAGAGALGRDVEACVGQKCYSLFNTGDCRTANCAVARAMQMDTLVTSDTVAKLPGGELPIRYTGKALKDEHGNLIGALEYVLDISKEMVITDELTGLAAAAVEGDLSKRADAAKFEGNYKTIVEGVNTTIDALLAPITEAADVLEKVAQRQLNVRVEGEYKGDHAAITNNLNMAVENLDISLTQVAEATEQVTSASNQISSGSQNLAQGSNEQASSLEEVSSSLEEMSATTSQNADNAKEAKDLSQATRGAAETGNEVMERMSEAMGKIKSSSDETAKIIKTIDEIAFQTNLLALNAAVEAARAGEAGKGFAVVAEEVRNLAMRSAEAAKLTANMIEESQRNAEGGVKTVTEVAETLTEIVSGATKASDITSEIAAASAEQARGIDQVNVAVSQMSKITQQNAANSEESASAAEELASQAEELMNMLATFKLSRRVTNRSGRGFESAGGTAGHALLDATFASFGNGNGGDGDGDGNGASKPGNGETRKAPAKVAAKRRKPEEVIPLDDNEEIDF